MGRHVIHQEEFESIAKAHFIWELSNGKAGKKADFTNTIIEGVNFGNNEHPMIFSDVSFRGAEIKDSMFYNFRFANCDFSNSVSYMTSFKKSNINFCKAEEAIFDTVGFVDTSLSESDFSKSAFYDNVLIGANVSSCNLQDTLMQHPQFAEQNLFQSCNFENQQLFGVVALPKSAGERLAPDKLLIQNGNFRDAQIQSCCFQHTHFKDADFRKATVVQSNFNRATLENSPLTKALVSLSNFESTRFKDTPMHEQFVQLYGTLDGKRRFSFAYYPVANRITSHKLFQSERLPMKEAIERIKDLDEKTFSKDDKEKIASVLKSTLRHRQKYVAEFQEKAK